MQHELNYTASETEAERLIKIETDYLIKKGYKDINVKITDSHLKGFCNIQITYHLK
jgi:hypothetical protein